MLVITVIGEENLKTEHGIKSESFRQMLVITRGCAMREKVDSLNSEITSIETKGR